MVFEFLFCIQFMYLIFLVVFYFNFFFHQNYARDRDVVNGNGRSLAYMYKHWTNKVIFGIRRVKPLFPENSGSRMKLLFDPDHIK